MKIRQILDKQLLTILFVFCLFAEAGAVTLTPSTHVANVGDPIAFTSTILVSPVGNITPPAPAADLFINFGDGSPVQSIGILSASGVAETHTRTHAFARPGTYTVRATGTPRAESVIVQPPATRTVTVTIFAGITSPPRGEVGEEYEHDLAENGGQGNRYRVIGGRVPPGLEIAGDGKVQGVPTQKGTFTFTLLIQTPLGATTTTAVTIVIDPGVLRIQVQPGVIDITRSTASRQRITFRVIHPEVRIPETIRSTRGEFVVGGRVVGQIAGQLSINLNTDKPTASETITIPPSVVRSAQATGSGQLLYRRTFTAVNLNNGGGETRMRLRTAAAGNLRINNIRLYFEQNNRPIIQVKRNQRELTGVVDIQYSGSGIFKGYWQVDERILRRVQKNLFYGKLLTLKTPKAPPLPTYSEGGHRLQFIITEPESAQQIIDFPVAIYHVEARRAEFIDQIRLISPQAGDAIDTFGTVFQWNDSLRVSTYRIYFYENESKKPFFKVFTEGNSYNLNETLIDLKFVPGSSYTWQIKGFTRDGELVAESPVAELSLIKPLVYVPGEILFVVATGEGGNNRIQEIVARYDLTIVEQQEFGSVNRVMVLCKTGEDILELSERLMKEEGVESAQPNFIFRTMDEDPLRRLQSIDMLLDLDSLHRSSTGKGVLVAVIDTGIDPDHKDLQKNIHGRYNFIADSPYRGEIHGTAVAGVIAAANNDFGILGIAPGSSLLALRACRQVKEGKSEGECYSSSVAKAIDTALQQRADVINLSIGARVEDTLITLLLGQSGKQGAYVVAPVGNDSQAETINFPASHPAVISVAGFGDNYSPIPNRKVAEQADAIGPGQNIFSSVPGEKHNFFAGTSFSSAAISGIIALSLELNDTREGAKLPHFDDGVEWQDQVMEYISTP